MCRASWWPRSPSCAPAGTPVFKPLQQVLARPRVAGAAADAEPEITVMADKSLPYEVLKKVMQTATNADFAKISFAAVEKDKAVDLGAGAPK